MKALKARLLDLDGVSGVGEREGELQVYLAEDSPEVRAAVQRLADEAGVKVKLIVTGQFQG